MTEASALLTVQELDLKLLRAASALASMPQQARLRTIALARKKVQSELTGIVGQRKDAELAVSDTEAELEHYRQKTAEVQAEVDGAQLTHRQLRDYDLSLSSLAKRIEKCEFDLRPLRERLGKLALAEKNANLTLARLEDERAATEESLENESAGIKEEIRSLSREREAAASELTPEHLAAYEAARKRFKGLAVERLQGNVPSVCRVRLQPSQFHDLMHEEEICECPYCHRMLVTEEALS